jgi:hypothetical protein
MPCQQETEAELQQSQLPCQQETEAELLSEEELEQLVQTQAIEGEAEEEEQEGQLLKPQGKQGMLILQKHQGKQAMVLSEVELEKGGTTQALDLFTTWPLVMILLMKQHMSNCQI